MSRLTSWSVDGSFTGAVRRQKAALSSRVFPLGGGGMCVPEFANLGNLRWCEWGPPAGGRCFSEVGIVQEPFRWH